MHLFFVNKPSEINKALCTMVITKVLNLVGFLTIVPCFVHIVHAEKFPLFLEGGNRDFTDVPSELYPRTQNWFRVSGQDFYSARENRQSNLHNLHAERTPKYLESDSFLPENYESKSIHNDKYYDLPPQPVRSRRLYSPPVYTDNSRRQQNYFDDGNGPCKCDIEYVLKYRSNHKPGTYHVKVYHEESGHFSGEDRKPEEPISYPTRGNDQRKYFSYPGTTSRSQQQQRRPVEYFVEEVDNQGDRRGNPYPRGNSSPVVSPGRSGDDDRIIYKSRNPRAKFSVENRKYANLARKMVHDSNWGTLTFISSEESQFDGYPYTGHFRVSDGPPGNSSGIPYVFLTPSVLEASFHGDLEISKASITMLQHDCNPCVDDLERDWTCASVTLSGIIVPVTSTVGIDLAAESLMSRHSQKELERGGFFARIIIKNIAVQNPTSGRVIRVPVHEYFLMNK